MLLSRRVRLARQTSPTAHHDSEPERNALATRLTTIRSRRPGSVWPTAGDEAAEAAVGGGERFGAVSDDTGQAGPSALATIIVRRDDRVSSR